MFGMLTSPAGALVTFSGIAALIVLSVGIYWLFNKQVRLREIARLREKLAKLTHMDPEYGAVRALYTSMVIDAERWGFYHSGSGSHSDGASADHSGSNHVGDGDSGGGHH